MSPSAYQNIIFDFGGVILNLDYSRTIKAFIDLGISDFDERYSQLNQTDLFDQFERGEITPDEFRDGLRTVLDSPLSNEEIDDAWNAMLLDLPTERLKVMSRLHQEKNICLLSNTNEIHINCFEADLERVHRLKNLSSLFDKVYYSSRVGMRKPEPRIFELVLREQNFKASETLFIDDSPQHIEGAKKVGLNIYHLRADLGETILDLF